MNVAYKILTQLEVNKLKSKNNPDFGRMVVYNWNKYINEDPNNFGRMVVYK